VSTLDAEWHAKVAAQLEIAIALEIIGDNLLIAASPFSKCEMGDGHRNMELMDPSVPVQESNDSVSSECDHQDSSPPGKWNVPTDASCSTIRSNMERS